MSSPHSWKSPEPEPLANQPLDGQSMVPLFRDSNAKLNREAIYQHFPGYLGAVWADVHHARLHHAGW